MKIITKIINFLILLMAVLNMFFYCYLRPVEHFNREQIPLLVEPVVTIEKEQIEQEYQNQKVNSDEKHNKNTEKIAKSFNVLLLGVDARDGEKSRTDVIMLANIKPKRKKVTIISIPRDTQVKVPEIGYTKINHTHILGEIKGGNHEGTENVLLAVSNLLQCNINYYVKVNFKGFVNFVDSIGGIEVTLSQPISINEDLKLSVGENHLDGGQTLELARERFSLPNGDFDRQRNQYLIIEALAKKILSKDSITKIPRYIRIIKNELLDTNFTNDELLSLAVIFQGVTTDNIKYIQLPGNGEYAFDPLINKNLYYWIPVLDSVKDITTKYFN